MAKQALTDQIAITGYSSILPGASSSSAAWDALINGRCLIGEIPSSRWGKSRFFDPDPAIPGKTRITRAGLIADPFLFDEAYFGISPREATEMDPQQRLLLQTVARAFDHAALDPLQIDRTRVGVFVGASGSDHSTVGLTNPAAVGPHFMHGNTLSILANRISYTWDFKGPSYTVDTACSSGLYALDQARKSIASGEIDTAIVAGVNLLLSPLPFIGFSKASMLSPHGLCKAFSSDADGYVRAEGTVAFVLRRGDVAHAAGDPIRSLLVGTSVNTDGRTTGMALPSSERQYDLLRSALDQFSYDPKDLAFIEAHGTGTPVGDPIEAAAIGRAYGQNRKNPLPIGSAKTNFGHLEPASGLVGLLKAQMALEFDTLPASLHATEVNPHIDFEGLNLSVAQSTRSLDARAKPWLAAVNSFGFGGANAHAVIRQPDKKSRSRAKAPSMPSAFLATAASPTALRALCSAWCDKVAATEPDQHPELAAAIGLANHRLTRHRHRAVFGAETSEELSRNLSSWLDEDASQTVTEGSVGFSAAKVGFVFSGNGSQWAGMGIRIFDTDPVFRRQFLKVSKLFQALGGEDLQALLNAPDLATRLGRAPIVQPLLFSIQVSVVKSLAANGLVPHATLGHSVGEVAAAWAAKKLTLETAVHIIHSRSSTLDAIHGQGSMAALAASADVAHKLIEDTGSSVELASDNAPASVTLSGPRDDLTAVLRLARSRRIAGKMLDIEYPYHSSSIEPLRERMIADLADVSGQDTGVTYFSSTYAQAREGHQLNCAYWWQNARAPVRFRQALAAMINDDVRVFVEISPRPVLTSYLRDGLAEKGTDAIVLTSLDEVQGRGERTARTIALEAITAGAKMDERPLLGPRIAASAKAAALVPDYPFDPHEHNLTNDDTVDLFGRATRHVLLGDRVLSDSETWTGCISLGRLPWLSDHKIRKQAILPATCMVEMLLAAGAEILAGNQIELRDLEIIRSVPLMVGEAIQTRITHQPASHQLTLETRNRGGWTPICTARLFAATAPDVSTTSSSNTLFGWNAANLSDYRTNVATVQSRLITSGLEYGPAFSKLDGIMVDGKTAEIVLAATDLTDEFYIDPTIADAGLQGVAHLLEEAGIPDGMTFLPGRMGRIRFFDAGEIAGARLTLHEACADGVHFDIEFLTAAGSVTLAITEMRLRPFPNSEAPPQLYWDEVMVPVNSTRAARCGIEEALAKIESSPDQPLDDLTVIRDAIGARIAWDVVEAGGDQGDHRGDTRYRHAVSGLTSMGLITSGAEEQTSLVRPCPQPDLDRLIALLAHSCPAADDILRIALESNATSEPQVRKPSAKLTDAACAALAAATPPARTRLLLAGSVERSLVMSLAGKLDAIVVVAADADAEVNQRLSLRGVMGVTLTGLDGLQDQGDFDLIVGIGLSAIIAPADIRRLTDQAAPEAEILLVEDSADLFALMTGQHGHQRALARTVAALAEIGVDLSRHVWQSDPSVLLLNGHITGPRRGVNLCSASSNDSLAEILTSAIPEMTRQTDIVVLPAPDNDTTSAALAQAAAFRNLPSEGTTRWIVQDGMKGAASLRGWRRSVVNETGLDIRTISLGPDSTIEAVARLIANSKEAELECDENGAVSPRLTPAAINEPLPENGSVGTMTRVLHKDRNGGSPALSWRFGTRKDPEPHEVEIEVAATGLNFRDVMLFQGLLPMEALDGGFAGPNFGMECSGRVIQAGATSGFTTGDRVIAFARNAFASHVTVPGNCVMALPGRIDLQSAAAIPVIFLTADYALNELARLAKNEWVLIPGGAGGVGLAALQVARNSGAKIISMASTPEKRRFLQALGADHVLDSRAADFDDQVMALTKGRGVDVVLNSIAGVAMERALACLSPYGRFIELGKRDIYSNASLGMRALRNNISFFAVDADHLLRDRPEIATRVMQRLTEAFSDGSLHVPPVRIYEAEQVDDAVRLMQRAGHIGKILVRAPKLTPTDRAQPATPIRGTWMVAGGTQGFGLETARWLAASGAHSLWLVSRTSEITPEALYALQETGVHVTCRKADLTDMVEAQKLFDEIAASEPGLNGIVHSAMHLEDGVFANQTEKQHAAILSAKLTIAEVLDHHSRHFELDHFWLYSSVAARFGNIGQAAYVAANLGLEELARNRRSANLPALAIAWGPISDAGFLADQADLLAAIEKRLGTVLTAQKAMQALGQVVAHNPDRATITIARAAWSRLRADHKVLHGSFAAQLDLVGEAGDDATSFDIAGLLQTLGKAGTRKKVLNELISEAALVLRSAPSDLDPHRPLLELGFDSLMGMNLKLAAEERLQTAIPFASLGEGLTLAKLAAEIVDIASGDGPTDELANMASRHLTKPEESEDLKKEIRRALAAE